MGGLSLWHWLVVGIIILLLFGKGRFSDMMGDVARGLKSFKKGISDDDEQPAAPPPPPRRLEGGAAIEPPAQRTAEEIDRPAEHPAERREP